VGIPPPEKCQKIISISPQGLRRKTPDFALAEKFFNQWSRRCGLALNAVTASRQRNPESGLACTTVKKTALRNIRILKLLVNLNFEAYLK
jgi:hypothetical protein